MTEVTLNHFLRRLKIYEELFFIKFSIRQRARDSLDFTEIEKYN